ncbi:hypothetical protein, partial [Microseira wollei]|uniref:hypothetical protein n=1 Tax=Microseira wollei TaxID=467598 RepID=UPI001CFC6563
MVRLPNPVCNTVLAGRAAIPQTVLYHFPRSSLFKRRQIWQRDFLQSKRTSEVKVPLFKRRQIWQRDFLQSKRT